MGITINVGAVLSGKLKIGQDSGVSALDATRETRHQTRKP